MVVKVVSVPIAWLAAEYGLSLLMQIDTIPAGISGLIEQLPFVGVLVWLWLQSDKRHTEQEERGRKHLEYMLEIQRNFFKDIIDGQSTRINQMSDRIELLTQQLAVNTSTVNEVSKVDDVVDLLIKRLSAQGE